MTTVEVDYLDGKIQVDEQEPSTIPELVEIIGEEGLVNEGNSNLRYRNKYPRVYAKASKELEPLLARAVKEEKTAKDGTVRKIFVSPMDHLRECFQQDAKATTDAITRHAQAEPLYVKGERTGGGGKISQGALDAANKFFAEGEDVVDEKVGLIEGMVPGFKVARDADGNATPESLARGIQALNKHLMKEATQKALNVL